MQRWPIFHNRPQCGSGRRLRAGLARHPRRPSDRRRARQIFPFASVGVAPQDLKYKDEPTRAEIGEETVIRECVTISRGTVGGGGTTRVGSHCLIMAYAHIGHDSHIGNHCILANAATLAGHVIVEDYAVVGALCPVHQFCRIGKYSFIGGGTTITQDVLPFSLTSAKRETHAFGLNKIGLERRGFTREQLKALQHAYRLFLAAKLNTSQAIERLEIRRPDQRRRDLPGRVRRAVAARSSEVVTGDTIILFHSRECHSDDQREEESRRSVTLTTPPVLENIEGRCNGTF